MVIQMSLTFNDTFDESKEEGKDQNTIQSSTTPNSEHHMEKGPKHKKTLHIKRAKRLAQVQGITRLQRSLSNLRRLYLFQKNLFFICFRYHNSYDAA